MCFFQTLVDFLGTYIRQLGRRTKDSAEVCNRTTINLLDLEFAFQQMGIKVSELEDYVQNFVSPSLDTSAVVPFPAPSEIRLNFLKPGSREVLHRKMHVYDYLPPMHPELEIADSPSLSSPLDAPLPTDVTEKAETEAGGGASASFIDTNPHREIASVMMTSAGFISPAREGKLPESRTPAVAREILSAKRDAELMKPPSPKSTSVTSNSSSRAEQSSTGASRKTAKNKKLSVFQKKVPAVKQTTTTPTEVTSMLPPSPSPPPPPVKLDHDDIINSVIERGVLESQHLDAKQTKKVKKQHIQQEVKPHIMKPPEEPALSLSLPPPPKEDVKPYLMNNPLIPKQLYGFGEPDPEPKQGGIDNPKEEKERKSKSEKVKDKSKKKRAKRDKHDSERSSSSKRDKAKKKKRDRQPPDSPSSATLSLPAPPISGGLKIKVKEPPVEHTSKVVLKSSDPKPSKKSSHHPLHVSGPQLFDKPIKIEHKTTNPIVHHNPPTPTTSQVSMSSTEDSKRKRGRPEKRDKAPKKRKQEKSAVEDIPYEGGGIITTQTIGHYVDAEGNKVWVCPACGKQDDGSPMIGCDGDGCDDWYHFLCVGIQQEPESTQNWFCQRCARKQMSAKVKRGKGHKTK